MNLYEEVQLYHMVHGDAGRQTWLDPLQNKAVGGGCPVPMLAP